MRLEVDINDEVINDLVTNELNNVDQKIIADIAASAIKEYLSRDSTISEIIFKNSVYGYSQNKELRPEIWNMIEQSFHPEDIAAIQEKIATYMVENHKDLVVEAVARTFSKQLFTDEFRTEMAYLMMGQKI